MRRIELKPSRRLGLLLLGMIVWALFAIVLATLQAGVRLGLGAMVLGVGAWSWRNSVRLPSLRLVADGRLQTQDESGEWSDIEVLGDSFVAPALIVLRYRVAAGPARALTLLSDSADANDLRRLRVALRWTRRTRSDTSFPGEG